uniref:BTB domain-containing protein n=1 Tax=Panagrolaimus superbus TaxID=310955 RepID=A0A914YTC1_9BILA
MNAQEILYKFQMEKFEIFKSQDPENGKFDVVFEIDGKKLYANKYMLCTTSTTLESMLSDRWTKSNEPIPLHGHTFEDFKEFLTFLYSGKCSLTDNSIFAMNI